MSNHFSADNLEFPGDDRRLDLTDLFVFTSADDPGKTVLIMDSNPTSAPPPIPAPVTGPEFYPGAIYRINIDTDGDNHADVAFSFTFSEYQDGKQTGTAYHATVPRPASPGQSASPSSRLSRSASTAPSSRSRLVSPARSGWPPGCAPTRSSPTSRAPCTASPGPGTTTSPTTRSTPSRWKCPATCSVVR